MGYYPDLFPWGGVCHAASEQNAYAQLRSLVAQEVDGLRLESRELPAPATRPMREAVPV